MPAARPKGERNHEPTRFRPVSQGAETLFSSRLRIGTDENRLTRIFAGEAVFLPRVADGTRTRNSQDHNLSVKIYYSAC